MENAEREIDLIDLTETICKKWRVILLFTFCSFLIGVVISTGAAFYNRRVASSEMAKHTLSKTVFEAEKKMRESENADELKETANDNIRTYELKRKLYEMQAEYMDKSIYYSIDEERVNKIKLSYYIDNHFSVTYPVVNTYNNIEDVTQYFSSRIYSNELYEKLIESVYPDSEYKYMQELIAIEKTSTGNFEITVIADTKDNVELIADILKDEIQIINKEVTQTYGKNDCILQSEQYTQESDRTVADSHTLETQKLIEYKDEMQKIEKSMSGAQLDYFKAKLGLIKHNKASQEEEIKPVIDYISKKTIAIVTLAGMFLILAFYGSAYIFSGKIKTKDDIAILMQEVYLGNLQLDITQENSIDRFLYNIFHKNKVNIPLEQRAEIVTGIIVEALKKRKMNSLCIGSTVNLQQNAGVTLFIKMLSDNAVEVHLTDEFLINPEGMKQVNESDVVIIVEQINCSIFSHIEQELQLLKMNDTNILGYISV